MAVTIRPHLITNSSCVGSTYGYFTKDCTSVEVCICTGTGTQHNTALRLQIGNVTALCVACVGPFYLISDDNTTNHSH